MAKKKPSVVSPITLAAIVAATLDPERGFMYATAEVINPLVEAGFVEVNPALTTEAGELAARATQKGIEEMNAPESNTVVSANVEVVVAGFKLEAGIPVPDGAKPGRKSSVYPFDLMEVGQSFFVPNSEDKPDAAKSMVSTCATATGRYAVGTGEFKTVKVKIKDEAGSVVGEREESREIMRDTRKFVCRPFVENGVAGARIWRVQ